jgi:4-alpha-glucanotransferase
MKKSIGISAALFSLPGKYGIGDLESLHELLNMVAGSKINLIQLLPLNVLASERRCPYLGMSAFAFHPVYISLERLPWLKSVPSCPEPIKATNYIDYDLLNSYRYKVLKIAYKSFLETAKQEETTGFHAFLKEQSFWLTSYAEFHDLCDQYGEDFRIWPELASPRPEQCGFYEWLQWVFYIQWQELKNKAEQQGIHFMGDLPIGISKNSADQWQYPQYFKQHMRIGLPPDPGCPDGQKWGMSAYRWENMEEDGYQWWNKRLHWLSNFYHSLRLDHFQAFHSTWEIPEHLTGKEGVGWIEGPQNKILPIFKHSGLDFIIEDLGYIPEPVMQWFGSTGYPGYRVMLYGWGDHGGESGNQFTNPQNYPVNTFATTSTHDTVSFLAFARSLREEQRYKLASFLGCASTPDAITREAIRQVIKSPAKGKLIPVLDILERDAVLNYAGTRHPENWRYRIHWGKGDEQRFKRFIESLD